MFSCVSSFIALRIVSELQVRDVYKRQIGETILIIFVRKRKNARAKLQNTNNLLRNEMCIRDSFSIDIQHVLPCCHDPLGRYGDEAEDKSLYATRSLSPKALVSSLLMMVL